MKKVLVLLSFLVCGPVFAEQPADLDEIMQNVAADLSDLHWKLQDIYESDLPSRQYSASTLEVLRAHNIPGYVVATADPANIYKGAASNTEFIKAVSAGKKFLLVDKINDWYAVALDKPVKGLSTGWVEATQVVPIFEHKTSASIPSGQESARPSSTTERMYSRITEMVHDVRQKYEANPLVTISGFRVDISLPPGVSILFQFK